MKSLDMIYHKKDKRGLFYSSVHATITAVTHFFEINDVTINKHKLNRFMGENIEKFECRSYTHEEITTVLKGLDERGRAPTLLIASTEMRV